MGCVIEFDPVMTPQSWVDAIPDLRRGDVLWQSREKVEVDGICKRVIGRAVYRGLHDIEIHACNCAGTVIECAPVLDRDTSNVIYQGMYQPIQYCTDLVPVGGFLWPQYIAILCPEDLHWSKNTPWPGELAGSHATLMKYCQPPSCVEPPAWPLFRLQRQLLYAGIGQGYTVSVPSNPPYVFTLALEQRWTGDIVQVRVRIPDHADTQPLSAYFCLPPPGGCATLYLHGLTGPWIDGTETPGSGHFPVDLERYPIPFNHPDIAETFYVGWAPRVEDECVAESVIPYGTPGIFLQWVHPDALGL